MRAARDHSTEMHEKGYFSHDSYNGESAGVRIKRYYPWRTYAENIAWGSGARGRPGAVFAGWMKSPGHRDNILDSSFTEVGFGVAGGDKKLYTADFGRK